MQFPLVEIFRKSRKDSGNTQFDKMSESLQITDRKEMNVSLLETGKKHPEASEMMSVFQKHHDIMPIFESDAKS